MVFRCRCDAQPVRLLQCKRWRAANRGHGPQSWLRAKAQLRALACSHFPGCRHTLFVDAHHIGHWADGGDTSLENLTLLCSYHHRLLHEGAFRIRRGYEGTLYFQRADGRVIPQCGYRVDDVLDDTLDVALDHSVVPDEAAEGGFGGDVPAGIPFSAAARTRKPSAEVREPAAVYRVA